MGLVALVKGDIVRVSGVGGSLIPSIRDKFWLVFLTCLLVGCFLFAGQVECLYLKGVGKGL